MMNKLLLYFFVFCFVTCSSKDEQEGGSLAQEIAKIEMHNVRINQSFIDAFASTPIGTEFFTIIAPRTTVNKPSFNVNEYLVRKILSKEVIEKTSQIKAIAGNTLTISKKEKNLYINDIKIVQVSDIGTARLIVIDDFFE